MRGVVLRAVIAAALTVAGPAVGQEKSQQNAADEAAVKGDLGKAKDSGDPSKVQEAEQKLEDAAVRAKQKTDAAAGNSGAAAAGEKPR